MSFTSIAFLVFLLVCVTGYYMIPEKYQWQWLLVFSYVYYLAAGPALVCFLVLATLSTWLGGLYAGKKKRLAVVLPLLFNFGVLAVLKYLNFSILNINRIFGLHLPYAKLLLPLGISFYTFQAAGYLLDVWWGRCEAERNLLKYALFVSFFPQIMQGPIGRYKKLSADLFAPHAFRSEQFRRGLWRIGYGLFKKMVIADNAALYADAIFGGYRDLRSLGLQGVLLYGAQLYADFSGGIDIVAGIAQLLGITLDENFRQPFFAVSITDFWHRWHITLGNWMKDYLFYPLSLSGWMGRFGKWCRKTLPKDIGRALPICISNIIVFLVVGIWHGAAWHFILYGLYNGLLIGISGMLAKPYRSWKRALHIQDKSAYWRCFQIIRTFCLVNISWFFDRGETLGQAFFMMRHAFSGPLWSVNLIKGLSYEQCVIRTVSIGIGCLAVFVVSLIKEKGIDTEGKILSYSAPVRILLAAALVLSLGLLGNPMQGGGFIYANF